MRDIIGYTLVNDDIVDKETRQPLIYTYCGF